MTDELKAKVERLRALAPRLNAASEEAGRIVQAVEGLLNEELSLGVSAFAPCYEDEDIAPDEEGRPQRVRSFLAYSRVAGRFRILVNYVTQFHDDDDWEFGSEEYVPWSSCPREVKLASFASLPALLDAIAEKASQLTETADATAETVRGLIESLTPSGDKKAGPR